MAVTTLLSAGVATAQGDEAALAEVIVTAQKRAENIQTVPISVSALTAEQLTDQKIGNIFGIPNQIPNMQMTLPNGGSVPIFTLRGVSALDYSQNQSSPVAVYVDEVYKGVAAFTSLQVFDLDRVEVLRGPQGTLYGRNTTGGAVNFYSKTASVTDGTSGYLSAGAGNFDRREVSGAINLPLVDGKLATRLAFTRSRADGYAKNLFPGGKDQSSLDDWAARLSTTWVPREGVEVVLRLGASESTPTGYDVIADNIGLSGPGGVAFGTGYTRDGLAFDEGEADITGRQRVKNKSASLHVTWALSDTLTLTSVSAFDDGSWFTAGDDDGTPFNIIAITQDSDAQAWSQDFHLASAGAGSVDWLLGAFFYKDKVKAALDSRFFYSFAFDDQGVPGCFIDFFTGCVYSNQMRQDRESYAAYGQLSWKLTGALSVTAGLRLTHDKNSLDYYRGFVGFLDAVTGTEFIRFAPIFTEPPIDHANETDLSGKLGLEYRVNDRTMLYASYSRGYRGGAFAGQAQFSPDEITYAKPETVDAFEVGAKTETADRRLRINTALFYYNYKNQQYTDTTPTLSLILTNAPKSRLYGGELELTARPVPALDVRVAASYLNGKYRNATLRGVDLRGNRTILAPEWSLSGGIDWRIATTPVGSFSLHTHTRYTSKVYYDAFNTDRLSQPGLTLHDARLSYEAASLPIRVSAWVTNLTDKKYRTYRVDVQGFNFDYAHRGRPREYGVEVSYSF